MGLLDFVSSIFSSSSLVWAAAAAFIAYTWQVQQQANERAKTAAQRARMGAGAASRTPPGAANSLNEARQAGKGAGAGKAAQKSAASKAGAKAGADAAASAEEEEQQDQEEQSAIMREVIDSYMNKAETYRCAAGAVVRLSLLPCVQRRTAAACVRARRRACMAAPALTPLSLSLASLLPPPPLTHTTRRAHCLPTLSPPHTTTPPTQKTQRGARRQARDRRAPGAGDGRGPALQRGALRRRGPGGGAAQKGDPQEPRRVRPRRRRRAARSVCSPLLF